jgi:hypothetical protein
MGESSGMAAVWDYAGRMALQDPALAVDAGARRSSHRVVFAQGDEASRWGGGRCWWDAGEAQGHQGRQRRLHPRPHGTILPHPGSRRNPTTPSAVAATDALEEDTGGVQAASTPRTASRVALRCFLPPPVALHASYGFVDIPHQSMLRNRALASLTVHQRCRGGRAGVLILAAARCRCSQSLGKKMTS